MKIGINASFLRKPDTGIGQVTCNFINELIKLPEIKNQKSKIKEVDFFLYLERDIALKLPKNFHKRVFLPAFWRRDDLIRKIWWEKFLLPQKIKKDKCDIFVSLYQCPTFLPKNIRHKMLVHDLIPKIFPEYLDNWRKKLYFHLSGKAVRHANEIFTISEWSKRDIHKYLKINLEKIIVANPSVGKEFFAESDHRKDNEVLEKYGIYGRYVFYIGGFDVRKNLPGLLEAWRIFLKRNDSEGVKLVLGGKDQSAVNPLFTDIKAVVEKYKLQESVNSIGFVEQKDIPAIYRNCDLFVFPSFYEGFGLTPLEAMASGAPTAVSKSSSLLEVGGNAVVYFNPYEPEEMARVMGKVLRNNKLRLKLGEKGKERAKQFDWKNFVEIILK